MSKRECLSGSSPLNKKICDLNCNDSDEDMFASSSEQNDLIPASASPVLLESSSACFKNLSLPILSPLSHEDNQAFEAVFSDNLISMDSNDDCIPLLEPALETITDPHDFIAKAIIHSTERWGIETTVEALLNNKELKQTVVTELHRRSHNQLKSSLSKSLLCSDKQKKNRNFLLSVTPKSICEEFKTNAPDAFNLLFFGLMGVNDVESMEDNSFLMNRVALMYSTIANQINRKATGYAMVQTSAARDGGLREDSLKLIENFCYPTTMQRYDRKTLAKDWDKELKVAMEEERQHFLALDQG